MNIFEIFKGEDSYKWPKFRDFFFFNIECMYLEFFVHFIRHLENTNIFFVKKY